MSHAVHPSMTEMCSSLTPASSSWRLIGSHEIEVDFRPEVAVARRTLVQKQHRISMWMALESNTSSNSSPA